MIADRIEAGSSAMHRVGLKGRTAAIVCAAAFVILAVIALSLPLRLPLGAFYWDVAVYLDAFHRISLGQAPAVDFFAPVGPLDYYSGFLVHRLFPNAHPLLVANWATLPLSLPLALVVIWQRGAREHAIALMLPFLVFAALPINLWIFDPAAGLDGFGNYNRHTALLLYWLVASLIFVEPARARTVLVAITMLLLVLVKVTGATAGAVLVAYACLAGRLRIVDAVLAALGCVVALVLIDWPTGLVRAYIADILTLIGQNRGTLLPRILTVASAKFGVVLPASALVAMLAWADFRDPGPSFPARLRRLIVGPAGWLAAALLALTLFETQNTGSLEFIGLWPVLLLVLLQWATRRDALKPAVVVLALAVALPSLTLYVERGARALIGMAGDVVAVAAPEVGPLARVSLKRGMAERASAMLDFYPAHAETYRALAEKGFDPSPGLQAQPDYHATWLLEVRQGLNALREWEVRESRTLNGFFTLDFIEPFNGLLGRTPPRGVAIGITPGRNLPALSDMVRAWLAATDAILVPKCPVTPARLELAAHFAPALAGRRVIALSPCWDMHLGQR